jgi:hypothetical protein
MNEICRFWRVLAISRGIYHTYILEEEPDVMDDDLRVGPARRQSHAGLPILFLLHYNVV